MLGLRLVRLLETMKVYLKLQFFAETFYHVTSRRKIEEEQVFTNQIKTEADYITSSGDWKSVVLAFRCRLFWNENWSNFSLVLKYFLLKFSPTRPLLPQVLVHSCQIERFVIRGFDDLMKRSFLLLSRFGSLLGAWGHRQQRYKNLIEYLGTVEPGEHTFAVRILPTRSMAQHMWCCNRELD